MLILEKDISPADLNILPIYDGAEEDLTELLDNDFTLIGWGLSGPLGSDLVGFGTFHAGKNRVNEIKDNLMNVTFDKEKDGGLPLEALCQSGDSGSPLLLKTGPNQFDYTVVGVVSNAASQGYGAQCQYAYAGGIARDWIVNNMKLDQNGDPLPAYEVEECGLYFDPDGDGAFWEETHALFDADGDNNISFAEWEPAYGVLSSCACENSEAMFARFDEDNNG